MDKKTYKAPVVAWLKVTDYMHGWLQHELGCSAMIKDQKVVCIQHLPGARDILRMETEDDDMEKRSVGNAMSALRRNCVSLGLLIDQKAVERMYGMTVDAMKLFVPIECPRLCLNRNGVLRKWTLSVGFGREQATALQRLLRAAFWKAVEDFNAAFARCRGGARYTAMEMIEAFCQETKTSELYIDAMRREWQRRVKRGGSGL